MSSCDLDLDMFGVELIVERWYNNSIGECFIYNLFVVKGQN